MYKSVKITEDSYRAAKRLAGVLGKDSAGRFGISNAIEYALGVASDSVKRKRCLMASAGKWADMDPSIVDEIYRSRLVSTRPEIKL